MMTLLPAKLSWPDLKQHRLSILCLLGTCLGLFVCHLLWLEPIREQKAQVQATFRQQEELAEKYKQKLDQAQSIRENLVKQEKDLREMQKRLFRGNDPYQLAASLGDRLSAKGDPRQKLDIKTYQVIASKEYGLYQEVTLRFNFMTTIEGLHYFLERVRNFETALLVQEINIQKI